MSRTSSRKPLSKTPVKRCWKKKIYICSEGGKINQTEKNYFTKFIDHKRFTATYQTSSVTAYKQLYQDARKKIQSSREDQIDYAFILFDLDLDSNNWKEKIEFAKKNTTDQILFIPSNPMFEYWLLLHFEQTRHGYNSKDELMRQLRKHIPQYKKNYSNYQITSEQVHLAAKRAKLYLDPHNRKTDCELLDEIAKQTGTLVYRIIEVLDDTES
ncbi:RloB family protein [Allobaculum sp. JKK-2023]|uniref:RloB family protein n=1 Tax=Allobaculum sp. JKK-2023 TaxID=3108943 RepID=UPI002B0578DF|nr:RloB family protein [Allobaculum sp. JKK-2023]